MFRLVSLESPNNLAVIQDPLRLSFRELSQCVSHVNQILLSTGITLGSYVLNNLESSIGWLVTMLATFDAKATYVPVETKKCPGKGLVPKLSSDISDHCRFMIASADTVNSLVPELNREIVPLDVDPRWERILKGLVLVVFPDVLEDREPKYRDRFHFAYIIHTSGTTRRDSVGVPVRVPVDAAVTSVIGVRNELYRKTRGTGPCFVSAPPTFDPSVTESIAPLSLGRPILFTPPNIRLSPSKLLDVIIRNDISVLPATPSLLSRFSPEQQQDILQGRTPVTDVLLGGEPLPRTLLREIQAFTEPSKESTIPPTVWNLYGTTEVGVWATLARISRNSRGIPDEFPDLGIPLPNTTITLMDAETGTEISGFEVTGEVYIGGNQRTCIVGDELEGTVMRPTGDLARYDASGRLAFFGRKDRVVKRMGRKVPLDEIADVLSSLPGVRGVHVLNTTDPRSQTDLLIAFVRMSEDRQYKYSINDLKEYARENCDSYTCPDRIIEVDEEDWRITSHGKVDETTFLELFQKSSIAVPSTQPDLAIEVRALGEFLKNRARVLAGISDSIRDPGDWYYLAEGADSMTVRRAAQEVIEWIESRGLVEHARLHAPDGDLQRRVVSLLLHSSLSNASRFLLLGSPSALVRKRKRNDQLPLPARNVSPILSPLEPLPELPEDEEMEWRRSWQNEDAKTEVFRRGGAVQVDGHGGSRGVELRVGWRVGMEKCVDAAPLVVRRVDDRGSAYTTAFFVSHSGLVSSVSLSTGRVHWRCRPGGRLEAPPDLTPCGKFLIMGSHDGNLYFVPICPPPDVDLGDLVRKVPLGSEIKCPPAQDSERGIMWCGSANGRVVGVECSTSTEMEPKIVAEWNAEGGVSAGILVNTEEGTVIVATLRGNITCLHVRETVGPRFQKYRLEIAWSQNLGNPIFSTPVLLKLPTGTEKDHPEGWIVAVGCVDGKVTAFFTKDGTRLWTHTTTSPLFAPLTTLPSSPLLLIGSQNGTLTTLNATTGHPLHVRTLGSRIFGAPCFLRTTDSLYVMVCTVQGKLWVLKDEDEVVWEFPEEVFSSPVLVPEFGRLGCVVVGCRDDAGWMIEVGGR